MKRCFTILLMLLWGAFGASAAERGLDFTQVVTKEGEQIALYNKSYALLIGASDYTGGWPDLPGVKKDVQAVQTALEAHGFELVLVEDPTYTELGKAFRDFINQYGQDPENRLLFYFAGHGHTQTLAYGDDMGYIVPVDAPNPHEDEAGFLAAALDMQMIEVYAKRIQSKHAIFLFDSCFSGSIFSLTRAVPEAISYKTTQPVRQFLTSGSAEEQVPDESIFRQQFIAALEGEGDLNGDGYVTGAELGQFLQDKVVNYSKGSQHPQYGKIRHPSLDKGDFVFQLSIEVTVETATTPAAAAPAESAPAARQGADPESEMWELIEDSEDITDVEDFLTAFPDGKFANVARLKQKQLLRRQEETAGTEEQEPRDKGKSAGKRPVVADGRPVPKEIEIFSHVLERMAAIKRDLQPVLESRDAEQLEKRVRDAEGAFDKELQDILAGLEMPEPRMQAFERLLEFHESLPEYLEKFTRHAEKGRWDLLQKEMEERFAERKFSFEELRKGRRFPPMLQRALKQLRNDVIRLRKQLREIVAQRNIERFEAPLWEHAEAVLRDTEEVLDIIAPPPAAELLYELLEDGRDELSDVLELALDMAWEDEWDELEKEWEPVWQEFFELAEPAIEELEDELREEE